LAIALLTVSLLTVSLLTVTLLTVTLLLDRHHSFKSVEEFHFVGSSITVLIDGSEGSHGTVLIHSSWITHQGEYLIEEAGQFLWFKGS
jgi:hypothetical protein